MNKDPSFSQSYVDGAMSKPIPQSSDLWSIFPRENRFQIDMMSHFDLQAIQLAFNRTAQVLKVVVPNQVCMRTIYC